jgi:hypothetical protein
VDGKDLDFPASSNRVIRRIRTDTDRILWIDAVRINKADLKEREKHVSIMGEVYHNATQNLVRLGPSQESTAVAIAAMDAIWLDILRETNDLETYPQLTLVKDFIGIRSRTSTAPIMLAQCSLFFSIHGSSIFSVCRRSH